MTPPKGKQRSIHMDDETFDILERLAGEYKANNSTIVRMALIQFDRGTPQQPRDVVASPLLAAPYGGSTADAPPAPPHSTTGDPPLSNILPDPRVSSFSVSGGKVRGKVPRRPEEDDGLDV